MSSRRTYEGTHPWIRFSLNLRSADAEFWMLLGEAQSKCEHIAGVPLLPSVAAEFLQVSLAKGVLATTAIEGNTLSEDEVRARISGQHTLPPSREYMGREVDNVIEAVNQIGREVLAGRKARLSDSEIQRYNEAVLQNLPLGAHITPGAHRSYSVGVGNYRGAPHEDCAYLLARLCDWLNGDWLETYAYLGDYRIAIGVLKAIVAHLYLAWIHPFGDGNGRTARLVEFQILLQERVPGVAAHLLSNHYNNTRAEYYRQLDASSRHADGPVLFIKYALRGFVDSLRGQINTIQGQQLVVHWQNHIHQELRGSTRTAERRRHLALDLPLGSSTNVSKIPTLTPRLAKAYASRSLKTVRRDLTYLSERELVTLAGNLVEPHREALLAFLPGVCPRSADADGGG